MSQNLEHFGRRSRFRYRQELVHVVGLAHGAIVLRQKWSRGLQIARLEDHRSRFKTAGLEGPGHRATRIGFERRRVRSVHRFLKRRRYDPKVANGSASHR